MEPVTEGLHLAGSIVDLTKDILDRADRDGPDKQFNEYITKIQNAFADNTLDSDEFRLFIDKLCNESGQSLTPTRDPGTGRRELLHALLIIAATAIRDRKLMIKAIQALQKK